MAKVLKIFQNVGPNVFPDRPARNYLFQCQNLVSDFRRPLYSSEPLQDVIETLLGKNVKLGDAKHPLLIPAVNLTQGKPQVFKTRHHESYVRDWEFDAVKVALATSAAPTFFP